MSNWLPWLLGIGAVALVGALAWVRFVNQPTRRPGRRPGSSGTGGRPGRRPTSTPRPRGRSGAPPKPRGPGSRPSARSTAPARPVPPTGASPKPGEIWWADVPYEDGTGSKVRPCLVLRLDRSVAHVLKITSQDQSRRTDHVRIPTKSWDSDARHDSFLDLTDPIRVATSAFEDRAGTCDPALWRQVRRLHGTG